MRATFAFGSSFGTCHLAIGVANSLVLSLHRERERTAWSKLLDWLYTSTRLARADKLESGEDLQGERE